VNPVNVGSIGEYIRQQREQAKISLRQLASAAGVSNPYLSQIERGLRRPSAEILQQIAKGLRISAEALYVQAGILESRRPDSGVRAAVLADPDLTERQKQVLLEIYESFRRELATVAADQSGPDGAGPVSLDDEITAVAAVEAGAVTTDEPGAADSVPLTDSEAADGPSDIPAADGPGAGGPGADGPAADGPGAGGPGADGPAARAETAG
jgi:transcriptional regulator with XRE-family HTH domain